MLVLQLLHRLTIRMGGGGRQEVAWDKGLALCLRLRGLGMN